MTTPDQTTPRFMKLSQVAEMLATTDAQVYALVRSGQLPAIKIGGRGQWRVESTDYLGVRPGAPMSGQVSTLMTRPRRPTLVPHDSTASEVAA